MTTQETAPHVCPDGFPLDLSPMGWAKVCKVGDDYSYEARGMVPVSSSELDALCDACHERGLEIFGGDTGLHVESNGETEAELQGLCDDAAELRHLASDLADTLRRADNATTKRALQDILTRARSEGRELLRSIKQLQQTVDALSEVQ